MEKNQKVESCTAYINPSVDDVCFRESCDHPAYADSKLCVYHLIDTSYGTVDTFNIINVLANLHERIIFLENKSKVKHHPPQYSRQNRDNDKALHIFYASSIMKYLDDFIS